MIVFGVLHSEKKRKKEKKKKETGSRILKNREKGLPPLREIINACVRIKKNKRDFSLAMKQERHSQKIIVIDLIIVKLFGVYPVVFSFKEKGFFV